LYIHKRENELRIMDIALLPEFRGQGIGSRLLSNILQESKNLNLPVTIHVEQFNPAMRLYQRMGFQPKEDKGVYVLMEWSPANKEQSSYD
jgi:ribosomal protein S18 acetylase RimI-like enzyme